MKPRPTTKRSGARRTLLTSGKQAKPGDPSDHIQVYRRVYDGAQRRRPASPADRRALRAAVLLKGEKENKIGPKIEHEILYLGRRKTSFRELRTSGKDSDVMPKPNDPHWTNLHFLPALEKHQIQQAMLDKVKANALATIQRWKMGKPHMTDEQAFKNALSQRHHGLQMRSAPEEAWPPGIGEMEFQGLFKGHESTFLIVYNPLTDKFYYSSTRRVGHAQSHPERFGRRLEDSPQRFPETHCDVTFKIEERRTKRK
ncbi:MAG: hypothetical protein V1777_00245 [Candidatus Micrarchaeota archaeon]